MKQKNKKNTTQYNSPLISKLPILLWIISLYISYILMLKFSKIWRILLLRIPFSERHPIYRSEYWDFTFFTWLISLIIWIIFIICICKASKYKNKLKLAIISLITAISFYLLFYVTHINYIYMKHSHLLMYKTLNKKHIVNQNIFFYFVKKYWFKYYQQDSYSPFKTLEESIKWLEFAKSIWNWLLYWLIFKDLDKFWYDKALELYRDKTFQVYFIDYLSSRNMIAEKDKSFFFQNVWFLKNIEEFTNFDDIKHIIKQFLIEYKKISKDITEKKLIELVHNTYDKLSKKIYSIKWINESIY